MYFKMCNFLKCKRRFGTIFQYVHLFILTYCVVMQIIVVYGAQQCNYHGSETDFLILECMRSNQPGMWPCIRNILYIQKDIKSQNFY